MGKDNDQSIKVLTRQMEWEVAKGHIKSILPTFYDQPEKAERYRKIVTHFFQRIQGDELDLLDVFSGKMEDIMDDLAGIAEKDE